MGKSVDRVEKVCPWCNKTFYVLPSAAKRHTFCSEECKVTSRASNLPAGSTQEIVLDVRGRGFSDELIDATITAIRNRLANIYPDIPITILRY